MQQCRLHVHFQWCIAGQWARMLSNDGGESEQQGQYRRFAGNEQEVTRTRSATRLEHSNTLRRPHAHRLLLNFPTT